MQKRQGTPEPIVPPIEATDSNESDKANPGEVQTVKAEQRKNEEGKYGTVPVPSFKPHPESNTLASEACTENKAEKKETSWIEIELVGEDDKPVPGEKYRITLPDGTVAEGTLDQVGHARVEGFEPCTCDVSFPDLDAEVWEDK